MRRWRRAEILSVTLNPPPPRLGITHWSTRLLARELGVSRDTVARIWREYGVQPWRSETFKFSTDPELAAKVHDVAVSRVLSRSGTWVVLHGASLVAGGSRRVAVIVEPAHPARIAPLLMSAYGLTEREREVTRLVLQGSSTAEIAARLVLSTHTVQQHLKRVFDKTGVRSRRDLVGKVFFSYYEPRVRDNERRAVQQRPLRGGPLDGGAIT